LGLQGMPLENQNGKCNWCVVSVFWMLMLCLTAHVHSANAAVNMTAAPSTGHAAPSTRASCKPFDGLLIKGNVGRRETRWVGLTEICPLSFVLLQMLFCLMHNTGPTAGVSRAAALPPPTYHDIDYLSWRKRDGGSKKVSNRDVHVCN
jgi:hypothetical protein